MAPEAPNVSASNADNANMGDEVVRGTSATLNPSAAMKFENHDAGTARRIQRPEKLK